MAASRTNWICWYNGESQIYSSGTKEIIMTSPLPGRQKLENKHVAFITFHPDTEQLVIHELPEDEILNSIPKETKEKRLQNVK